MNVAKATYFGSYPTRQLKLSTCLACFMVGLVALYPLLFAN